MCTCTCIDGLTEMYKFNNQFYFLQCYSQHLFNLLPYLLLVHIVLMWCYSYQLKDYYNLLQWIRLYNILIVTYMYMYMYMYCSGHFLMYNSMLIICTILYFYMYMYMYVNLRVHLHVKVHSAYYQHFHVCISTCTCTCTCMSSKMTYWVTIPNYYLVYVRYLPLSIVGFIHDSISFSSSIDNHTLSTPLSNRRLD